MADPAQTTYDRGPALNPGRFARWLDERIPPTRRLHLTQRNVFIFPTRTGFAYGALVLLLGVGAINYQSSLIFSVAFMLGAIFLVTILHTFRNLSGLTLELVGSRPGFAGEDVEFQIRVERPRSRAREGIQLGWPDAIKQWADLTVNATNTVKLFVPAAERGWFEPGRLLVETFYPLGVLRAWTWVDLKAVVHVYPRPLFEPLQVAEDTTSSTDAHRRVEGNDDLSDVREYRPGDSVRQIMWRAYARSDELHVREHEQLVGDRRWLDFDAANGDTERRLSVLTGHAIAAHKEGADFGLRLAGVVIEPGHGTSHFEQVLKALAVHGRPRPEHADV